MKKIFQSPESPMPDPYATYIEQRARTIGTVLEPIIDDDTAVQLCPRAIFDDEAQVDRRRDVIYGCVVKTEEDGLKSALYNNDASENLDGILVKTRRQAIDYATTLLQRGESVRVKEPDHSDGQGQATIETIDQLEELMAGSETMEQLGIILMPHLDVIADRFSLGRIHLGRLGTFVYLGREYVDNDTFAGGDIAVTNGTPDQLAPVGEHMNIPPRAIDLGFAALRDYEQRAVYAGRYSVDVISGTTSGGRSVIAAVDLTPRVGGHTPAEVLAVSALHDTNAAVATASGRLYYAGNHPDTPPLSGTRFIDTDTLVMVAAVTSTAGGRS